MQLKLFLKNFLFACIYLNAFSGFAQVGSMTAFNNPDTLCFQAKNGGDGKDVIVSSLMPNTNYATHADYPAIAWTNQGNPVVVRAAVEFDISVIPPNAQVLWAGLSLYNNPTSFNNNGHHSSLSGPDDAILRRITQHWVETTATWNYQPVTTTQNQVAVPQSSSPNQDYIDINVTAFVQDMVNDTANSHGFMLQLSQESIYRCLIFASSDHPDVHKHPKLCVLLNNAVSNDPIVPTSISLQASPNPATSSIRLSWNLPVGAKATLSVVDLQGRTLYQEAIQQVGSTTLQRLGFSAGMYLVRLESVNGVLASKRIVFE